MPKVRWAYLLICLLSCTLLSLAGCDPATEPQAPTEEAAALQAIECHTAYRHSVTVPPEREATLTLTSTTREQQITFSDLVLHARYWHDEPGGEGPGLRLAVTAVDSTSELAATLYQLPTHTPPQNQFAGGHGFTGLSYVYHPNSGAELQYWCIAR